MAIGKDHENISRGDRLEELRKGIIKILKTDPEAAMDCYSSDSFTISAGEKVDYSVNSSVKLDIKARENDPKKS